MVRVSPPGCRAQVGVQTRSLTTVLGGRGGKLAGLGALGGPGLLPFRLIGVAVGRGRCRGRELGVVSTRVQVPALRPRTLDTEAARRRDRHVGEILLETRLGCGRVPELALWPCALGAVTALGPDRCRRPQHPPLHRAGEGGGRRGRRGRRSRRIAHCARALCIGWCDEQDHLCGKQGGASGQPARNHLALAGLAGGRNCRASGRLVST